MIRGLSIDGRCVAEEHLVRDGGTGVDKVAIGLSVLCLVHCLALPMAVLLAPALEAALLGSESHVHWILLGLALPTSCYALWHGYRHHGRRAVPVMGFTGLAIMLLGVSHVTDRSLEAPITVVGVLVLLVAHVINLRFHAHGVRSA
jgi:hypothetical protein